MHSFTHNDMARLLELQGSGLIIYNFSSDAENDYVHVGKPNYSRECPHCHHPKSHKHGGCEPRYLRHGVGINGKTVWLEWHSFRLRCPSCGRTRTIGPPSNLVSGRQRSTKFCRRQALKTLVTHSFNATTAQTGIGYQGLRAEMNSLMATDPLYQLPKEGNLILGIDGHSRSGRHLATTLTLLVPERRLIGFLATERAKELKEWVNNRLDHQQRLRVSGIVTDMTLKNRLTLKQLFPATKLIIDRYHVVAYFNRYVSTIYLRNLKHLTKRQRKLGIDLRRASGLLRGSGKSISEAARAKLDLVLKELPAVCEAWYWKEEVRAIYRECRTAVEAQKRWQAVLANVERDMAEVLTRFLPDILNYFPYRITNGFTEGVHTKCKLIKRLSFGIKNMDCYVKKLALGFVEPKLIQVPHTY